MFLVIDESCQSHFFINSFINHFSPSRSNCVFFLGIKRYVGDFQVSSPLTSVDRPCVERDLRIAERCLSRFGANLTALDWPQWVEKSRAPRVWNSETFAVVVEAVQGYLHNRD